jgi:hypothetical protein
MIRANSTRYPKGLGKDMECGETRTLNSYRSMQILQMSYASRIRGYVLARLAEGKGLQEAYKDAAKIFTASMNLAIGVGAFNLEARAFFTICKKCDPPNKPKADYQITVSKLEYRIWDHYNWDRGKSTYFPGYGRVHDKDMKALEKPGGPASFVTVSDRWSKDMTPKTKEEKKAAKDCFTYRWNR